MIYYLPLMYLPLMCFAAHVTYVSVPLRATVERAATTSVSEGQKSKEEGSPGQIRHTQPAARSEV